MKFTLRNKVVFIIKGFGQVICVYCHSIEIIYRKRVEFQHGQYVLKFLSH